MHTLDHHEIETHVYFKHRKIDTHTYVRPSWNWYACTR